MPSVPKKIGRTKGYVLVTIGLVFGLLQALLTIPFGGGLAYFVMIGAILAALGFLLVAARNKLLKKVKTGAIISAVILIVAVILSFIQLSVMSQMEQDIQEVGDSTDNVNSGNWEEKQSEVTDSLRNFVTNFLLFVILLATATALMAIAVAIPPLRGKEKKKLLMLIPLVIAVLAIIAASLMTHFALDEFRGILDDFEEAENQGDFEDVANDVEDLNILGMVQGSRIGGILNFIAILMAIILSYVVKVGIEDPTAPGDATAPGYTAAPGYPAPPGYAAAPTQHPPYQETRSFNCPHCKKIFTAQQTEQVQQVSCPSCRGMVTINPLQPKTPAPRPSPPLPQPPAKLPPRQIKQPVQQPPKQQPRQQPAPQPPTQPPEEKPQPQQPAQEPPAEQAPRQEPQPEQPAQEPAEEPQQQPQVQEPQQPAEKPPTQTQSVQPSKQPEKKEESAIDILKKRLAKGEIDLETYRELKKEIE